MVLLRPLALLLALTVFGEELVGGETPVLIILPPPLRPIPTLEWICDPPQISYHRVQGLGESQEKGKDLTP